MSIVLDGFCLVGVGRATHGRQASKIANRHSMQHTVSGELTFEMGNHKSRNKEIRTMLRM